MMGGIPEVPAGDLGESWPPLCSPLLPPAGPCSPRAPAWNPGLAAASAPTLSSAQLSSAGHSRSCSVRYAVSGSSEGSPEEPHLPLVLPHPPLAAALIPARKPLPHPSPCTNHSKNNNSNNNQGHTARPACRARFYSFHQRAK